MRAGLRRVIENTSWLFVERWLVLIANFTVSIWFINYLGPALYGRYAYAVSFAALFVALAGLGLQNVVVRELSLSGTDRGEVLGTAFLLRIGSALATLLLVLGAASVTGEDAASRLLIYIVALSVLADPARVVDLWFQSRIESKYMVWLRSGVTLAGVAAKAGLILAGLSLVAFAWLYAAQALAIGFGALLLFAARLPADLRLRASAARARRLLADSWPLIIAGLSVSLYMRLDRVMLGRMLGEHDVGTYSTAAALSEVWTFFPLAIASSLFPIVVQTRAGGDVALYHRRLQALYDMMALFGYGVAVFMTAFGAPLIELLFTVEFGESARILQIHIWSLVFVALGVARSRWLVAENRIRFSMITTLVGAALNVALNLLLIPRAGGAGAALATLISYAVAAYFSCWLLRDMWPTARQLTRALLAPLRPRAVWREMREILRQRPAAV